MAVDGWLRRRIAELLERLWDGVTRVYSNRTAAEPWPVEPSVPSLGISGGAKRCPLHAVLGGNQVQTGQTRRVSVISLAMP